jgi:HSP20 family protein
MNLLPSLLEDTFNPLSQWFDDSNLVRRIAHVPAVNIKEHNDNYVVAVAAPGLKKEDFKIDLENNLLTVSSEKEEEKEEKEARFSRREYSYTSFSRSFSLPDDVKQDAIAARYENGELRITLPKKEGAKKAAAAKQISVQ